MTFEEEFKVVRHHTILLAYEWKYYKELFSKKEDRELLVKSASNFFVNLSMMYIDSIILKIAKLLEAKTTGSNKNLTIDYLIDKCTFEDSDLLDIQKYYKQAKGVFDELKPYRHKNMAHLDMKTAIEEINHLPIETQQHIELSISLIFKMMNIIEVSLHESSTAYEEVISTGGASTLLFQLNRAQKYKELVKEKKIDEFEGMLKPVFKEIKS